MKSSKFFSLVASSLAIFGLLIFAGDGFGQAVSNPPVVYIFSPTNNSTYLTPANLTIYARAVAMTGTVQTVQFFAGTARLGVVTNGPGAQVTNGIPEAAFPFAWSNVLAGSYALKAIVTDSRGAMATSAVVNISVVTNFPVVRPSVYIYSPTNGSMYLTPASLTLYASAAETTGTVQTVEFFAGSTSLGVAPNGSQVIVSNISSRALFPLAWSNILTGSYSLKAVATDTRGITATSSVVSISVVTNFPLVRPSVYIYSPTNNAKYLAPASLMIYARAVETTGTVQTVQFFNGSNSLGVVSNSSRVVVSNLSSEPLYALAWSNVTAGSYALKAMATDTRGITATSAVVTICVTSPPPNVPFAIGFMYPTNGQTFTAPANVGLHAWVTDSNVVRTIQYFAGATSVGTVTNAAGTLLTNATSSNPFFLSWSNVPAGAYAITALATDSAGLMVTSTPVNVTVAAPTNRPPEVRITSPPTAAVFRTPINIPVYAYARDPDGAVTSVEFFAGATSLGLGNPVLSATNNPTSYYTNLFFIVWSNAPQGDFSLTAKATDNRSASTVSTPIKISVLPPVTPPTNRVPVVSIVAIDPVAIEGTNCWVYPGQTNSTGTWSNSSAGALISITNCGPKNATFSVYRSGDTTNSVTITYATSGTASNGVDYVSLSGCVTIPAGQRQGLISVVPVEDGLPDINRSLTIKLTPSTVSPPLYSIGSPASAGAIIVDSNLPRPASSALADKTFHLNATGPNGAWFHVEETTDMVHWTAICTNQVVNGSIDFIDPAAPTNQARFYRAVPEANPPQNY